MIVVSRGSLGQENPATFFSFLVDGGPPSAGRKPVGLFAAPRKRDEESVAMAVNGLVSDHHPFASVSDVELSE